MFRRRHMHSSKCCHYFCPPLSRKRGDIKSHSSVRPSLPPSVRLSVTKTLTWLISFEVLMIEHWYLTCMIIVTSPFYWYHAVTLTFDLSQGQIWCRAGTTILRIFIFTYTTKRLSIIEVHVKKGQLGAPFSVFIRLNFCHLQQDILWYVEP